MTTETIITRAHVIHNVIIRFTVMSTLLRNYCLILSLYYIFYSCLDLLWFGDEGTSTFACFAWCTGDGGTAAEHELFVSNAWLCAEM